MLVDQPRVDLCRYRLEKAERFLNDAKSTIAQDMCETAANRSYYAIFHTVRALLALDGKDFKKHSGVISYFQQQYIKTGVFDKEFSDILNMAFSLRTESDYKDFYVISREDVIRQVEDAERFLYEIKRYIESLLNPTDEVYGAEMVPR